MIKKVEIKEKEETASIKQSAKATKGGKPNLKVIPLGGLEEVGKNMTLLEYDKNIIIIDMGLKFAEEDMPGVDFIVPSIDYLKDKKDWIKGVFITHAHYDHIGAIPYLIDKLGYPPIYTTLLSKGIILKRQEDFPSMKKLHIETINKDNPQTITLGPFQIDAFHVNHNIPDAIGLAIKTPVGLVIHTCDFKFDFQPVGDKPADLARIVQLASQGTLLLLSDSTGADSPGHSLSEEVIMENLDEIFEKAQGRIIVSTFASLIGRIQQIIWLSEKYNRKVAIDGYSMKSNIAISRQLNYLQVQKNTIIEPDQIFDYPDNRITILCTGAQGEDRAILMRIANKEHRYFKIKEGDSVVFSSSIVPGNERSVQNLKDSLYRQGAKVFHYKMMDIHASGHAYEEDLKLMINLVKPKFFLPIHGQYFMLKAHAEIAQSLDIPKENIVIASNGSVVEVNENKIELSSAHVSTGFTMISNNNRTELNEVVIKDRQMMAENGIMIVIALIDTKTFKVVDAPDVISRGFIYMKESKELVKEIKNKTRFLIERKIAKDKSFLQDSTNLKNYLKDQIGELLSKETSGRPIVIPVIKKI